MSRIFEVKVPDICDHRDILIIEVFVEVGDMVETEQSLVSLESDKSVVDIPSPKSGVVKTLHVHAGKRVEQGEVLLELEEICNISAKNRQQGSKSQERSQETAIRSEMDCLEHFKTCAIFSELENGETEIKIPETIDNAEIVKIFFKPGDIIQKEDILLTLKTEGTQIDVESPISCIIKSVTSKVSEQINKFRTVSLVERTQITAKNRNEFTSLNDLPTEVGKTSKNTTKFNKIDGSKLENRRISHASPSVRKFARELGIEISSIDGSGPKGRILNQDIYRYIKRTLKNVSIERERTPKYDTKLDLLPWPKIDFDKFGPNEKRSLSRIKKISGMNLHRNWVMIPHVTHSDAADITDLEKLRGTLNSENQKSGFKITILAFLMKACAFALKKFSIFNTSLDGDHLIFKKYFHVGFAVDTSNGLIVPVIRDVDKKGIFELAQEISKLANLSRDGKLKLDQMQGGCFSISSLGSIGGNGFTPIINAPETAILGVCQSKYQPIWDGKQFVPRLMLPISLSYDHRVIDGAEAAKFSRYLVHILTDFRRVTL